MIAAVRRRNPNFYPKAIKRVAHPNPRFKDQMVDIAEGFLTLEELIEAHGQIGALMHAANPYREKIVIEKLEARFSVWRERLIKLLDHHQVKFPGGDAFLYVGMQSVETGGVHTAFFTKVDEKNLDTSKRRLGIGAARCPRAP